MLSQPNEAQQPNEVLVTGGSAGAIGVMVNVNSIQQQLSSLGVIPRKFGAIVDAGVFLNITSTFPGDPFPPLNEVSKLGYEMWQSVLDSGYSFF